ncbi:helix-turn-helix domain-containing protein [Vibrio taketomensis]
MSYLLQEKTISEFSKLTGIHRNTLTRMANQTATRVELSVVEKYAVN